MVAERLEWEEGYRSRPYRDTKGKLTIGIGRNLDDRGISYGEARYLLSNDIRTAVRDLESVLPFWPGLDDVRKLVLVDLYFNMRLGNPTSFASEFSESLRLVAERRYAEVADRMRKWKWFSDVKPGRADALISMMRTGTFIPVPEDR